MSGHRTRVGSLCDAMCSLTWSMPTSRRWKMPAASAADARVALNTCGREEGRGRAKTQRVRWTRRPRPEAPPRTSTPHAHLREVLGHAGAGAGDDGDGHGVAHGRHQVEVKALRSNAGKNVSKPNTLSNIAAWYLNSALLLSFAPVAETPLLSREQGGRWHRARRSPTSAWGPGVDGIACGAVRGGAAG